MKQILQKMKQYSLLVLLVLMGNYGWGQNTAIYTVGSTTSVTTTGNIPSGSTATYSQTYTTAKQLTAGKSATLTLSGYGGYKITNIVLEMKSNSSAGAGTFSVVAGSTSISSVSPAANFNTSSWYGGWSLSYVNVTKVPSPYSIASGENVVITIGATVNSLFIQKYSITYEPVSNNDTTSKVESPTTQVSTIDLASTATASGSAVDVFKFKVSDLGSGDVLATKVTQVKIKKASGTADWTDHIAGVSLWDGANQITTGTATITDTDITIPVTSGNLDIGDGTSKEISLKLWLNTTNIVDNATMAFTVSQTGHDFISDASGSSFATDFGAAVTSITVTVRGTATQLVFTTQPSSTACPSTNLATAPVVKAVDANGTVDLDYTSQITLTNSGALGMTGNQVSAVQGVASFTNLQFTQSGAVTLNATAVGLPDSSASNSVTISLANVTSAASSNGDTTSLLTWSNPSCFDEIMIVAKAVSAASIVPSGDGTTYSASLTFGLGSAFDGGFVVYKGGTSSQTVTGLTNGTTYYFTYFTRKGSVWSTGVSTTAAPNFMSQASDYFRTKASGNWNSVSTWESSINGSTNWISATLTPTSTANTITILSGHNVTVTAAVSVDQVIVTTNGKIIVNSGKTLTIADGADGFDLRVSGIIENSGTITATGAVKFERGGYYKHTANGGSMVEATWDANSTCEISGVTSATSITNLGSGQTTAYGNLIWNCTGQTNWFNATGSFDVAGNFTVNSTGTRGINLVTSSSNRTFNIGGNLEINGAKLTLTNSSGIATLNIGGNLVLNNSSLNQLDFGYGSSAPSSGDYRSVINLSGDFYNDASSAILITTTASYYGKIAFVKNGEQIFNNSSVSDMNGIEYIVNSGSTLKLNTDMFLGQYDFTDVLGTLDCGSTNKISGNGFVAILNGGVLKTSNSNASDAIIGSVTATGGLTLSTGSTIELNGTVPQFLGARTFSNLTVNNPLGVSQLQNITVSGSLTQSLGKLSIGTNTLTVNRVISGSGTTLGGTTSNLAITGTAGTLYFDQTTPGTTNVLKNLTITGSGTTTLANALNITAGSSSGVVTVGTGATLNTGGFLTFKSDANGTASFGNSAGTITGNVTVERFIPSGKRAFRLLSPAVTTSTFISGNWQQQTHITGGLGATGLGFDATETNNPSMFTYNNLALSGSGWTAIANTNNTNLTAGVGYRVLIRGDRNVNLTVASQANMNAATTLSATGTLRTGTVTLDASSTPAINNTANTTTLGYSLVGNPYQSAVDWNSVTRSGIDATYWAWDPNMGTGAARGNYVAFNVSTGTNNVDSQVGRYIQPGQAFFVMNTTLGTAGTLTFQEAHKATTSANVFRTANETESANFASLSVQLYDPNELAIGGYPIDATKAVFSSDYTNELGLGDATKLEAASENIAWFRNNTKLAIDAAAPVTITDELVMKTLRLGANKNYTFKIQTTNFDTALTPYLVDTFLNTQTEIATSQAYLATFATTSNVASYSENRFKIVFQNALLNTDTFATQVGLYPNPSKGNGFYLQLPSTAQATVRLYNTLGQEIAISHNEGHYQANQSLAAGVYHIMVTQGEKTSKLKWIVE